MKKKELRQKIGKYKKTADANFLKSIALLMAVVLTTGIVTGCGKETENGSAQNGQVNEAAGDTLSGNEEISQETDEVKTDELSDQGENGSETNTLTRPMNVAEYPEIYTAPKANVEPYTVAEDLSNISNLDQFYLMDSQKEALIHHGFFVMNDSGSSEFFEEYEINRYLQKPNFVTVDSLMHTYHLYFSYLLQKTEKEYLADQLFSLTNSLYEQSLTQLELYAGTEWESAAKRNVAFFGVACNLLGNEVEVPEELADTIRQELELIYAAEGIVESPLMGAFEDYSQYRPRGYYEGDEMLEQYFRCMMWCGRISFEEKEEDQLRSALLMSNAIDACGKEEWEKIYVVTSFFAGASDDLGYYELQPIYNKCYGDEDIVGNEAAWDAFKTEMSDAKLPAINSIPIEDGEDNQIRSFRFMGQRFSVDADIMQNLIYQKVGENPDGNKRMLPDTLDVMAALGSDTALEILDQQGDTEFDGYSDNMEKLRDAYTGAQPAVWKASLYAGWLNTLRPLLEEKGEGYPMFMRNREWATKNLETFAGSYTELKHDTVLYSKQVMAEMGGGEEEIDDRGYVEPEPVVYDRFSELSLKTSEGLKKYGVISEEDESNLKLLSELALSLRTISEKELQNEALTDEEYELIRTYGGNLEHFWYEAMKGRTGEEYIAAAEYPSALITDIATDPNGQVLEVGTGRAETIYVVVPVDGELKIATGSVYSFYQFPWTGERLTDSEWRYWVGVSTDDNYMYYDGEKPEHPAWTQLYRLNWEW